LSGRVWRAKSWSWVLQHNKHLSIGSTTVMFLSRFFVQEHVFQHSDREHRNTSFTFATFSAIWLVVNVFIVCYSVPLRILTLLDIWVSEGMVRWPKSLQVSSLRQVWLVEVSPKGFSPWSGFLEVPNPGINDVVINWLDDCLDDYLLTLWLASAALSIPRLIMFPISTNTGRGR